MWVSVGHLSVQNALAIVKKRAEMENENEN